MNTQIGQSDKQRKMTSLSSFIGKALLFLVLAAMYDTAYTQSNMSIDLRVANGIFDVRTINYGDYHSNGFQFTSSLNGAIKLNSSIDIELGLNYTANKFQLDKKYPDSLYLEPPVTTKDMRYLSLRTGLAYRLINKDVYVLSVSGGIIFSRYMGDMPVRGIYQNNCTHCYDQFSQNIISFSGGVNFKYYFANRLYIPVQLNYLYHFSDVVTFQDNSMIPISIGIGLGLTFPN